MKINREARRDARKLFSACLVSEGQGLALDAGKARIVVTRLCEEKPRNYLPLLQRFKELVAIEEEKRTYVVESAVELPDKGASIFADLAKRFGAPLATRYTVKPGLLGGIVVLVGSRIWDGSLQYRLRTLTPPSWIRRRGVDIH